EGWIAPGLAQGPGDHRCRCRLSVRASDRDQPLLGAELGQELTAMPDVVSLPTGKNQLGIVLGYCRGDDHLDFRRQVFGRVADDDLGSFPLQALRVAGRSLVGTTYLGPEPQEGQSQTAHACAADP